MTLGLRIVIAWMLIGLVTQLVAYMVTRKRIGRYAADTLYRIMYFGTSEYRVSGWRLCALQVVFNSVIWPVNIACQIVPKRKTRAERFAAEQFQADFVAAMHDHCPDCGGRIDAHIDMLYQPTEMNEKAQTPPDDAA